MVSEGYFALADSGGGGGDPAGELLLPPGGQSVSQVPHGPTGLRTWGGDPVEGGSQTGQCAHVCSQVLLSVH